MTNAALRSSVYLEWTRPLHTQGKKLNIGPDTIVCAAYHIQITVSASFNQPSPDPHTGSTASLALMWGGSVPAPYGFPLQSHTLYRSPPPNILIL